jgi:cell division protein FtsQ
MRGAALNARRTNRRPSAVIGQRPARLQHLARAGARVLAGMGIAVVLVLGVLAWAHFDLAVRLPVEHIEVVGGTRHVDIEAVQALVGSHAPGFFGADLDRLREALEARPWVAAVRLRRRWPDTLVMRIIEPVPVARWGENQLVDRHGQLFGPVAPDGWEDLPALRGKDGRQVELMKRYLEVSARLADAGFEVVGLEEGARHDWTIHLADQVQVLMGRNADLARLGRLVRAAPAIREQRDAPLARIDMRYPHGLAVAWANNPDEASGSSR